MPTKIVFEKEAVARAAYNVIERDGIGALNARSVAKELGCSTQPIYLRYPDMGCLKNDADKLIRATYTEYLERGLTEKGGTAVEGGLYMGYLTAYVKFAAEKPNLFAYLFMRYRGEETAEDENLRLAIVGGIS